MDEDDGEDDDHWEEGMPQDTVGPGTGGSSSDNANRLKLVWCLFNYHFGRLSVH